MTASETAASTAASETVSTAEAASAAVVAERASGGTLAAAVAAVTYSEAAAVLTADVLARLQRASDAAARTYRLARYGYAAEDVAAEATAALLSEAVSGTLPAHGTTAAAIGARCKRLADAIRRQAERETASGSAADVVSGGTAGSDSDGSDVSERQRRAVLSRRAVHGTEKRTDVLAVSDFSRRSMRAADVLSQRARDAAARLLAEAAWLPVREAERQAWHMLSELAEAEHVPAHGSTERHTGRAGRVLGTERVLAVAAAGTERASMAERAAARTAVRLAVSEAEHTASAARSAAALAETAAAHGSERAAALAEAASEAAALAAAASEAVTAARLARQWLSEHTRPAAAVSTRQPVTVAADVPASRLPLDLLQRGYVSEALAERVSAKRAASARVTVTVNGKPRDVCCPSRLADVSTGTASSGRDWLLATARHVSWTAALPDSGTATRAALQRGARSLAAAVTAATACRADSDSDSDSERQPCQCYACREAETARLTAEVSEYRRSLAEEYAAPYVPASTADSAAEYGTARADWLAALAASRLPHWQAAYRANLRQPAPVSETAEARAERLALSEAHGYGWHVAAWWQTWCREAREARANRDGMRQPCYSTGWLADAKRYAVTVPTVPAVDWQTD